MRRDYHPMMIYFYFILYIFYIYFNFKKINSISYYFVFYSQTLFRLVKNERLERYEIFFGDSLCSRRIFFFFQNSTKFFHNNLKTKKKLLIDYIDSTVVHCRKNWPSYWYYRMVFNGYVLLFLKNVFPNWKSNCFDISFKLVAGFVAVQYHWTTDYRVFGVVPWEISQDPWNFVPDTVYVIKTEERAYNMENEGGGGGEGKGKIHLCDFLSYPQGKLLARILSPFIK